MTALVIHGHFYQPPRENPWTGSIDRQPSAAPAHDWNERVQAECYRANAWARVVDGFGRIESLVDNYQHISFNFGPTVLSWMEQRDPRTYRRILAADAASVAARGGHGNAIAQAYNHAIMPLCNPRDRRTQVRWGLADFRHRFQRPAESMWLPETAADDATLGLLIDEGLRYVILSPHQAQRVRPLAGGEWAEVRNGSIDPGVAYRYLHKDGTGRSLAVFFYDGPIAQGIAFEGLLASSESFVQRLLAPPGGDDRIVHVATDGETYGHHHAFGDRTLAYALTDIAPRHGLRVTNYGEYLDTQPPRHEVEIKAGEGTAWSCAHGVGRWYRDCGCSGGGREGWNQAWRGPLRQAFDRLRDWGQEPYETLLGELLSDPWGARDDYVELVLDRGRRKAWLAARARRPLSDDEQVRALTLLEAQRQAMLMYTSCGWFFADISGIETVQVMCYAARALELYEELGLEPPREAFLDTLAAARSNLPELGNGADVYNRFVGDGVSPARVASHVTLASLVEEGQSSDDVALYHVERVGLERQRHGRLALVTGRITLDQLDTGRRHDFAAAVLFMGGVDFYGVIRGFPGAKRFFASMERIGRSLREVSLPVLLRIMQEELGPDEFGLDGAIPGRAGRLAELVLGSVVDDLVRQYAQVYEQNQRVLELLHRSGFELPHELRAAGGFAFSRRFANTLAESRGSLSELAYLRAAQIAGEAFSHGLALDVTTVGPIMRDVASEVVTGATERRTPGSLEAATAIVRLAHRVGLETQLDLAQEIIWHHHEGGEWPTELAPLARALGFAPAPIPR